MQEQMKCSHCEEISAYYTFDRAGEVICESCEQQLWQYASTIFHFNPDDLSVNRQLFCEELGTMDYEYGDMSEELPEPIKEVVWKQSDGWRGYTDYVFEDNYTAFESGWMTGYPDNTVPRKSDLLEFLEGVCEGKEFYGEYPCEFWIVIGINSNVFSQTMDVVVSKDDVDKFENWLSKIGADLDYMLS